MTASRTEVWWAIRVPAGGGNGERAGALALEPVAAENEESHGNKVGNVCGGAGAGEEESL